MTREPESLTTGPGIRLRPPSFLTSQLWLAEDLLSHQRFSLPPCGVLLLIACVKRQIASLIVPDIAKRLGLEHRYVESVVDQMISGQILLRASSPRTEWLETMRSHWATRGWIAAADYHLLTYDYEYLDYSRDAGVDPEIMEKYRSDEPDLNRFKTYTDAVQLALPTPTEDLIAIPFSEGWLGSSGSTRPLTFVSVASLLANVFGKVSSLPWTAPRMAPLMHRTSPSGGARHPTEAYVIALRIPGVASGWYHVRVDKPALEQIHDGVDQAEVERIFAGPFRAPFPVRAIIALTSLVERNMYRYREPRTLRTVYMDAGHLGASVEITGRALGIATYLHHGIDGFALEAKLELNGLDEGALLAIALG